MTKKFASFFASIGIIFTTILWGFGFVVVKDSLNSIGAIWMVALRFTLAAVLMTVFFFKKYRTLTKKKLVEGAVTGFFLFCAYATQTIGCKYTTAGKNAFLTTIYVLLVPLISWPLYKKRPGWYVFVAAAMSLMGIGLLSLGNGDKGVNRGDVLTLICGLFFALHIIGTEKCNKGGADPIFLTVLQFIFSAFFACIAALLFDGAFPLYALKNERVIISLLYLGIFSTMIAFALQNIGLKYLPGSLASLFMSFESVFGIIFSVIFLHEHVSVKMAFGCTLIFFAVVLAETKFDFRRKTD
ncbi:MAG: EamA family transporter [Treponema sp.]|nr:EamA family transporter [Treponema sp.]